MPKLPICSGPDVIRALERAGFFLHRVKGSHHVMRSRSLPVRNVTVPVHRNSPLKRGTLHEIIKQAGLNVDEFIDLL